MAAINSKHFVRTSTRPSGEAKEANGGGNMEWEEDAEEEEDSESLAEATKDSRSRADEGLIWKRSRSSENVAGKKVE